MMMNIMEVSNFLNQKNNFLIKDKISTENNKQVFSEVFNNEKRNLSSNKQNVIEKTVQNKQDRTKDSINQTNTLDAANKSYSNESRIDTKDNKTSLKETKHLSKYEEDAGVNESVENQEDESTSNENIIALLQSILSTIPVNTLNVEDVSNVDMAVSMDQLQNLVDLKEQLTSLLNTTDVLMDESLQQNIETTIQLINKISDEQSLTNNEQVFMHKQNINEVLNNLEELKNYIEPIFNKLNAIKIANPQKLEIRDQQIDLEKRQLMETDETLIQTIDTEKGSKDNVKVVDKLMSSDKEEQPFKQSEGDSEILFREQILVSHQETRDQIISLKVVKDEIVEPKQFINEIAQKAGAFLSKDKNEMSIQLAPENLGKLSIKVGLNEGTLTGKIYAENYSVKEIIEANLNQLRDALEEKGLNIAGLEVHIGDNSQNFERSLYQSRFTNRQKSKVGSMEANNDFTVLEQNVNQTNPYLNTGQFDSLV